MPTPWPAAFTVNFLSNVSWPHADFAGAVSGRVEYSWAERAQRITHGPGAVECVKFYGVHTACTLLTNVDGLYRLLPEPGPTQSACCLDMPSIHTPPPHWADDGKPSDGGVVSLVLRGGPVTAHDWQYPSTGVCANRTSPTSGCHQYMEGAAGGAFEGKPLLFSFPASDGLQDWYYAPESMRMGPIDPARFALPVGCRGRRCAAPVLADGVAGIGRTPLTPPAIPMARATVA